MLVFGFHKFYLRRGKEGEKIDGLRSRKRKTMREERMVSAKQSFVDNGLLPSKAGAFTPSLALNPVFTRSLNSLTWQKPLFC